MLRYLFLLCAFIANISFAQTWENYIKYFPRKSSTVVRDYKGNILKTHSLGVLDVRINSVQQCADAAIRLRAEYFYSRKEYTKIEFRLTNGVIVCFDDWAKGYRLHKSSKCITFSQKNGRKGYDRANFEKYLFEVMMYAGSTSLYQELNSTNKLPKIGDLLIIPGYPGHVVIIIDKKTVKGINYYLFANSWMPAQDIEIISGKNPKCRNFGNYTPILSTNDKIYINGYLFNIKTHLRTW